MVIELPLWVIVSLLWVCEGDGIASVGASVRHLVFVCKGMETMDCI